MRHKITKKLSKEFVKNVTELIKSFNPFEVNSFDFNLGADYVRTEFTFKTKFGLWTLTVHHRQSTCYTVFTKFKEFDYDLHLKNHSLIGDISPSGKWNVHQWDADVALNDIKNKIEKALKE